MALSGLGDIFDPARNAPAPTGKVVSRAAIQTYQQARDYALAAYHVVEDLAKKYGQSTLLASAASQYFDVAWYAKMSPDDIAQDFPGGDPLVSFKGMLAAADGLVDQWRAANAKLVAGSSPPSNVIKMPTANASSVAVPTTVTTAGIGTAKGAVVAIVAGGLLYLALRKKKRKGS